MKTKIAYIIFLLVVVCVCVFAAFKIWTLGSKSSDYHIICIGDHQYYRASFAGKGFLANRLNDNGQPVKCPEFKGL